MADEILRLNDRDWYELKLGIDGAKLALTGFDRRGITRVGGLFHERHSMWLVSWTRKPVLTDRLAESVDIMAWSERIARSPRVHGLNLLPEYIRCLWYLSISEIHLEINAFNIEATAGPTQKSSFLCGKDGNGQTKFSCHSIFCAYH